jgi:RHS repeat-associated protein
MKESAALIQPETSSPDTEFTTNCVLMGAPFVPSVHAASRTDQNEIGVSTPAMNYSEHSVDVPPPRLVSNGRGIPLTSPKSGKTHDSFNCTSTVSMTTSCSIKNVTCYGYRYYNPQLGRWPSRDPIEERGGLNLYAFALTDPISQTDYLGLTVYPGQSNCLGYGFTGRKGVCVWPEEGQSMKKYLKSDPSSKGCKAINNTGQCDCRGQISVILVFYTPEKYVGDPWESPQNWESTPGIDVHVMRKGCNSKDWTEVSSGTTTTEDTIVRTVDPGKWDGAGFKMVCCCQKCFTFYFHHELSTSASICENRSYII